MRNYELNKKFNNERDAFKYRDEIWFDYNIEGVVYCSCDGYEVRFED